MFCPVLTTGSLYFVCWDKVNHTKSSMGPHTALQTMGPMRDANKRSVCYLYALLLTNFGGGKEALRWQGGFPWALPLPTLASCLSAPWDGPYLFSRAPDSRQHVDFLQFFLPFFLLHLFPLLLWNDIVPVLLGPLVQLCLFLLHGCKVGHLL